MTWFQLKRYLIGLLSTAVAVAGTAATPAPVAAAYAGDNGRLVYRSSEDSGGFGELWTVNPDGSGQLQLTNSSAFVDDAAWSPDGTKIAYFSNFDIWVMNADGSGKTQLTDDPAVDSNPAWSPNGQKIAFSSMRDGADEIYVMDADGTNVTRLTFNTAADDEASWSPDGDRIAFTSLRDGNAEVYLMNPDGSDQVNLTNLAGFQGEPDWSPDGERLTFEGNSTVHVIDEDGTDLVNFSLPATAANPVWSPDGTTIAFSMLDDVIRFGIYGIAADGTGPITTIVSDDHSHLLTDWQAIGNEPSDTTDPTVSCDTPSPVFVLGGSHAADVTATVTDADSGPADASIEADVTAADVSSTGVKSKSLTGYDNAGNSTTASCPYVVGYAFGGFQAPLPASKNKAGSTIPVKFTLTDAAGATIVDADAQALVGSPCRIAVTFAGAVQARCPTYDSLTDSFKFDLKTGKKAPKGTQTITVAISAPDGSGLLQTHSIQVVIV